MTCLYNPEKNAELNEILPYKNLPITIFLFKKKKYAVLISQSCFIFIGFMTAHDEEGNVFIVINFDDGHDQIMDISEQVRNALSKE